MKEKTIDKELIKFIEKLWGIFDFKLKATTSIENDLGISGEDGVEFIKKYSITFNVDISNFVFSDYFYPEATFLMDYKEVKELTLGDLEEGVLKGILQ